MSVAAIAVRELAKVYQVRDRPGPGLGRRLRHVFVPSTRPVTAVEGLSFTLAPGERVAFVGPNGAGKSTTIKMLTGILSPSRGEVRVLGLEPTRERRRLGYRIGCVFGQRSQLWYHLPPADSFDLLARVYDLAPATYRTRRAELVERFEIGPLLGKAVRQLSLGERMRCELVASLLHAPEILFLDEPTIGLDVTAKAAIRELVRERSERDGCTVLLTSHDTGDVERVCDRMLVINAGRLILDRGVAELRSSYIRQKIVTLKTVEASPAVDVPGVTLIERRPHVVRLALDAGQAALDALLHDLLGRTALSDMTIEDPPMEEIVRRIYADTGSPA